MVIGSYQGERAGHRGVGKSVKCSTSSVLGGIHPGLLDADNNGPDIKGWRIVQRHRDG